MERQPIYIAYAVTSDSQGLMPVCWHTEKQRAGDVGQALVRLDGLVFWGVFGCNNADYLAINNFPDDHPLNVKK